MDSYKKIVWTEGMFLRPQHFQQQDRYVEFLVHQRSLAPAYYFWGFRRLNIDSSALALGVVSLLEAEGVFSDGTAFNFPVQSAPPAPLTLPEGAVDQVVHLAIPVKRVHANEVEFEVDDSSLARFGVIDTLVEDVNSVKGEAAELQAATPRLTLLLEKDLTDAWVSLGVLKVIERKSDRQVVLDEHFIPPVVACGAAKQLTSYLNELLGLVEQRADALSDRVGQMGRGGISEVGDFLMLQYLNGLQPQLTHLLASHGAQPEAMYGVFSAMCGELSTFVENSKRCPDLPAYQHDCLSKSFQPLVKTLRGYLSTVLERNAIEIELAEKAYGVKVGRVSDKELITKGRFILAVSADVASEVVKSNFPKQVKIGSVEKIRDLVNLQLPGIQIAQMPIAPRQIPYHTGTHYFEMDPSSSMWKAFEASGTIALHVAGDFPGLEVQCWIVLA
ncbi:type VI secretion system baseplate subunit TssK [uncultured Gilvimarinus sp.]|uniref:type VI secretion system baseplate subunit TssK n=1 Tax=uncultured Gilvimarinus sp. TaxID=1689143 RepID=UPI0030DC485C